MKSTGWIRVIVLAALAVGIWALAKYGQAMPTPVPADAPATQFSALRAQASLKRILGPQVPHPASTPAIAAVRSRILAEFAKIGVTAATYKAMGCNKGRRTAYVGCATVTDIIAPVVPGKGKAIILLAHYDSVPAGPGAADDGSGVATVIETARALRARGGKSLHPVIAVLTSGEEYGLFGAAAFLADPPLRSTVGVVVNVEARGSTGPSLLFQTSPDASRLIDLYAKHVPSYATSSLYEEIYKRLPNDTDLTLFLRDRFPGYNFAFTGRVSDYHTPLDTLANLSLSTLQQHGDNMLGVASALEKTPYADLKGHSDIYFDVLGRWLPRLPQSWALPAAVIALLLLLGAVAVGHGRRTGLAEWLGGAAVFPVLVIGAAAMGFLLTWIAMAISGMPDPSYAHPTALRIALAFGVAAVALLTTRFAGARATAAGVWLWLAALGVVVAWFLPGLSPYFLMPLAFAAVLMLVSARFGWQGTVGQATLFISALVALVAWLQLTASSEMLMGLKLHPLFTVPAAVAVATLVPLLAGRGMPAGLWATLTGGCFAAALTAAIVAGFFPAYSQIWPQRLNLNYVADAQTGKTVWAADATAPLPASLAQAADFSTVPERPWLSSWQKAYLAPAPAGKYPMPRAAVLSNVIVGGMRQLTLGLNGSSEAAMMSLIVPGAAKLKTMVLGQKTIAAPARWADQKRVAIACMSYDCAAMVVTLTMADTGPLTLTLIERRAGMPAFGAKLAAARPQTAVPSQFGDGAMLIAPVKVPAVPRPAPSP